MVTREIEECACHWDLDMKVKCGVVERDSGEREAWEDQVRLQQSGWFIHINHVFLVTHKINWLIESQPILVSTMFTNIVAFLLRLVHYLQLDRPRPCPQKNKY